MKEDVWVKIGGQRCRASELPYDLKLKLGLLDEEVTDKKEKVRDKPQEIKVSKVRSSSRVREKIVYVPVERREYHKSPDTGMDIVAKFIGRSAGRAWAKLTK